MVDDGRPKGHNPTKYDTLSGRPATTIALLSNPPGVGRTVMGLGGHAYDCETGRDISDHGSPCPDADIIAYVESLSHRRTRTDENPVAAGHVTADGGVGHHAGMIPEDCVVTHAGAIGDEGVDAKADKGRQMSVSEDDRAGPQLHPDCDVSRRVDDRSGRPTTSRDALRNSVASPRPTEAEHVGRVDIGEVVDYADSFDASPRETVGIDFVVVQDADDLVDRSGGVDGLHSLQNVAGVPAAANEHQGRKCHVTVPA
jgi:hypothetical protein